MTGDLLQLYQEPENTPEPAYPASGIAVVNTSMNVDYTGIAPKKMSGHNFVLRQFPIETKEVREALAQLFPTALNISVSGKSSQEVGDDGHTIHHQLLAVVGFRSLEEAEFHKSAIKKVVESFDPNRPIEGTQTSWVKRVEAAPQPAVSPGCAA